MKWAFTQSGSMVAVGAATPASARTLPCGLSKSPREAGIWAAAVTSLKMENLGPFNRSISDVEALIHAKYNHGSIL